MPAKYYSFVKSIPNGPAIRFVIIDTQDLINNFSALADTLDINSIDQIRWLKRTLTGSKQEWTFVVGHHPVFSAGMHGNTKEITSLLKPILEYYNVDFYICGHDHDFEHAHVSNKNTEYIVTGTGGAPRPVSGNTRTVFCVSALGFTSVSVSDKRAVLNFVNSKGDIVYNFIKIKQN